MEPAQPPQESPPRESFVIPQLEVEDLDFEEMIQKRLGGKQLVRGSTIAALPSKTVAPIVVAPRKWSSSLVRVPTDST
jgi:hypothetical protein